MKGDSARELATLAGEEEAQDPDLALLTRVARRDRAAFTTLYRRYHRRLQRFLARLLMQEEQAAELVNDVMLTVWQKAADFSGRSRVGTWILGIAYNKALKCMRSNARRQEDSWAEPPEQLEHTSPDGTLSEGELQVAVRRALAALPLEHRAVVTLTFFHGYSYTEIANIVQCPPNTVKTRMFHARENLRRLLPRADLWPGPEC